MSARIRNRIALAAALLLASGAAWSQNLLIRNATVHTAGARGTCVNGETSCAHCGSLSVAPKSGPARIDASKSSQQSTLASRGSRPITATTAAPSTSTPGSCTRLAPISVRSCDRETPSFCPMALPTALPICTTGPSRPTLPPEAIVTEAVSPLKSAVFAGIRDW